MNIRYLFVVGAAAGALALAACDNGPSAVSTRDRSENAGHAYETASTPSREGEGEADGRYRARASRRRDGGEAQAAASDDLGGGLKWAANRKYTADDNAHYQFDKRGPDFGLSDFKAFVAKADAFVAHPPESVLRLERSNGDTLLYDPKSNIFAVADKNGAPRTMLKPSDGMAYWDEQKDKEARRTDRGKDDGEKS